jgi:hypothetical protein
MHASHRLWSVLTVLCLSSGVCWAQLTYKTTSQTQFSGDAEGA